MCSKFISHFLLSRLCLCTMRRERVNDLAGRMLRSQTDIAVLTLSVAQVILPQVVPCLKDLSLEAGH